MTSGGCRALGDRLRPMIYTIGFLPWERTIHEMNGEEDYTC